MMTFKNSMATALPTIDEIRAELDRMTLSDVFRSSPQLVSFLRYVVEAALHGKQDRIKAYTIGVEVLRRNIKFDPQLDPSVRIEATRLRRAIERYYAGPGVDDEVIISVPKGSYVPHFCYAEPVRKHLPTQNIGNGMPVLLLRIVETRGAPGSEILYTTSLQEKIRNAFSRFETINIVSHVSVQDLAPASSSALIEHRIDYELAGTIRNQDNSAVSALFELVDKVKAKVVWSGAFELSTATPQQAADENKIVLELATKLLQPFGIIRSYERGKHIAENDGDPRYRCIVETSESFRSFDPSAHDHSRAQLEQLTTTHPDFGVGFSYLAAIYFREYLYGFGVRDGESPALSRALRAARHGIELTPESARAYHILFGVLFHGGDMTEAFVAGTTAMKLNPFDMTIRADYGGRLVLTGDVRHGMAMLAEAVQGGLILPMWEHLYVFLGNYLQDNFKDAAFHASQMTSEHYPLGFIARALVASKSGKNEQARSQIKRLVTLMPVWGTDPCGQMKKFFPNSMIANRLKDDLAATGLGIVGERAPKRSS